MTKDDLHTMLMAQLDEAGEQGLGIEQMRELNPTSSDRQLRYRLDALRQAGSIERIGKGRATRYVLRVEITTPLQGTPSRPPETSQDNHNVTPTNLVVPHHLFGAASIKSMARLALPPASRAIIHYDQDWLTELGTHSSLTASDRKHLHTLGATGLEHDIAGTYIRQINERLLIDLVQAQKAVPG